MLRKVQNWFVFLGVALLTILADRISKAIIVNNLELYQSWHPPVPFLRRIFSFTYTTNTGAAFGLFPDRGLWFVVIAVGVIIAILFYHHQLSDGSGLGLVRLAMGLQLGGAAGNLIDRLARGHVTDFIDINFWPLENWPVFNIADSSVVVGVCLLALAMLRQELQEHNPDSNITGETESAP